MKTPAFFPLALAFELALGVVALAVGWSIGIDPRSTLGWTPEGLFWGLLAAFPPLVWAVSLLLWFPNCLPSLRRTVDELLVPAFRDWTLWQLALISLAAGLGEELLFRGMLQAAAANWLGPWGGLVVVSLTFGMAHALNREYFFVATALGFYLGGLWMLTGSLLAAVVAHATYDFAALVLVVRLRRPVLGAADLQSRLNER